MDRQSHDLVAFFRSRGQSRQCPDASCRMCTPGAVLDARLQEVLRSRGFPTWFTVTVGPKGSYREHDVIAFLEKHLEEWREGRDWRILLAR